MLTFLDQIKKAFRQRAIIIGGKKYSIRGNLPSFVKSLKYFKELTQSYLLTQGSSSSFHGENLKKCMREALLQEEKSCKNCEDYEEDKEQMEVIQSYVDLLEHAADVNEQISIYSSFENVQPCLLQCLQQLQAQVKKIEKKDLLSLTIVDEEIKFWVKGTKELILQQKRYLNQMAIWKQELEGFKKQLQKAILNCDAYQNRLDLMSKSIRINQKIADHLSITHLSEESVHQLKACLISIENEILQLKEDENKHKTSNYSASFSLETSVRENTPVLKENTSLDSLSETMIAYGKERFSRARQKAKK